MAPSAILLGLRDVESKRAPTNALRGTVARASIGKTTIIGRDAVIPQKRKASETSKGEEQRDTAKSDKMAKALATRRAKREEEKNRPTLSVGVDFGTTNSGVSFVSTIDEDREVHIIKEYSGGSRQSDLLEKVPTRIAYGSQNGGVKDSWGYAVKAGSVTCEWFKLALDDEAPPGRDDDPLLREDIGAKLTQLPPGKSAEDVTTDYLTFLYKHIIKKLGEVLGKKMLGQTPIHFHFTMPATWSPQARVRTRNAAERAGFGGRDEDLLFCIDEPEAAAISVMRSSADRFKGSTPFKVKQGVIVVDLGGGTADLEAYQIISMDPLQVEEICIGIGAKCGGTSIDRALTELMTCWFGEAFTTLPLSKRGPGSKFMEAFETVKRDFDGENLDEVYEIHLKMRLDEDDLSIQNYDFETDEVTITGADMAQLFDTTVTKCLGRVREQLRLIRAKTALDVEIIILCGGLGCSPYILRKFEQFCAEEESGKIEVVRPLQPWSAICRGAALRGLEEWPVLTRRSRYHYGFSAHKDFNDNKHMIEDLIIDDVYGKRAKNQMIWPVKMGEKLSPGQTKIYKCFYVVPINRKRFVPDVDIFVCREDKPSARKDDEVEYAATISMDLTSYLEEERRRLHKDSSEAEMPKLVELDLRLNIKLGSEKGVIEAYATARRKKVGSTSVHCAGSTNWASEELADIIIDEAAEEEAVADDKSMFIEDIELEAGVKEEG